MAHQLLHLRLRHPLSRQGAIRTRGRPGFGMNKLSLVVQGHHSEEKPTGLHIAADRIKACAGTGVFWGGICGLLLAPTVFMSPGLGDVGMAGPLVTALFCALTGALVVGGLTALGASLTRVGGIPRTRSPSLKLR